MKGVDTIARVRREFFVRGRTIKEICRELHVSRNTVRKIIRSDARRRSSTSGASSRSRRSGRGGRISIGSSAGTQAGRGVSG
jgi:orotate phosphoribosyltransferase-like protein